MALIAQQWQRATGERTRFRGYDLEKLAVASRDFVCKACSNLCDMKEFTIEGQKSYWGDKCSDKFRKPSPTGRKPVIDDLFAYREQLLEALPNAASGRWKVGLPRAMSMLEQLPFWRRYFAELGIPTVLSPADRPAHFGGGDRDGGGAALLPGAGGPRARAGAGGGGRGLHSDSQPGGCRGRRRGRACSAARPVLPLEPDAAVGVARRARTRTAAASLSDRRLCISSSGPHR